MWRETRIGLEAAALRRSPVYRGLGLAPGERRPVLLIPGFMAGDASLGTMANWLRRAGYPLVRAQIGLVSALGTAHLPGMFRVSCLRGACCESFRAAMTGPFPDDVGYVAVYSRSDGIVQWRSCLDPEADELVEVNASHCGMGVNAQSFLAVANAITSFARDADPLAAADVAEAA